EGEGKPLRRKQPRRDRHVEQRLADEEERDAKREIGSEPVGRPQARPQAAPEDENEENENTRRSQEPQLLSDDREDEIGVRLGAAEPLLLPEGEAGSEDPPAAERDLRLEELEVRSLQVPFGMEEAENALESVGSDPDQDGKEPGRAAPR